MTRKNIIHLDDHELFHKGFKQACLNKPAFPVYHLPFTDSASCMQYVKNSLSLEVRIDLIITDFNHPGLNGYEFSAAIRRLCEEALVYIPILLLTMAGLEKQEISKGLQDHVFDKYLPKNSSSEIVIASIMELCQ
jgi:DNA-binding NarL/FixJ family response regulator